MPTDASRSTWWSERNARTRLPLIFSTPGITVAPIVRKNARRIEITSSPSPLATSVRSALVSASRITTVITLEDMCVRTLVGPRPVRSATA